VMKIAAPAPPAKDTGSDPTGIIIGVVLGSLLALAAAVGLALYIRRKPGVSSVSDRLTKSVLVGSCA
jgi:hypothetical protein